MTLRDMTPMESHAERVRQEIMIILNYASLAAPLDPESGRYLERVKESAWEVERLLKRQIRLEAYAKGPSHFCMLVRTEIGFAIKWLEIGDERRLFYVTPPYEDNAPEIEYSSTHGRTANLTLHAWMQSEEHNYADNARAAPLDDVVRMEEYVEARRTGCCGQVDAVFMNGKTPWIIGFDFGH